MTYSRRTWANGNQWDATAANDFEGRIETEFGVKATEIAAKANQTALNTTNSDVAALDTRLDTVEAILTVTAGGSLPGSPIDGQEVYYIADSTNGVIWHLRYRSGSSSTYKWEFVGGSPLRAEVTTDQGTTSTTYVDLTTVGPSVTAPLAGEYSIAFGAHSYNGSTGSNLISPFFGATAVDGDCSQYDVAAANKLATQARAIPVKALTASMVVKLQYRVTASTGQFRNRWLEVRPVRVG